MVQTLRARMFDGIYAGVFKWFIGASIAVAVFLAVVALGVSGAEGGEYSGLTTDHMWQTLGAMAPLLLIVIVGTLAVQLGIYQFLTKVIKTRYALPYTLVSPAVIALILFTVYPFFFNILLSFSDLRIRTFNCYSPVAVGTCSLDHLYGLDYAAKNFTNVFVDTDATTGEITGWGRLLRTENSTFPVLFMRTIMWTAINVIFHSVGGLSLALLLNQKIKFKGIYRSIILIPWAIPQVIVALSWKGEFHSQFGFVNVLLTNLGLQPVGWLEQPLPAFVAVTFVNIWLGIPFYMVILLGGLQSIPVEYYEAAQIDGASAWQRFREITLPLLRPIIAPAVTLDTIWTFNMVNVIYLITQGGPRESTDILVTALYNAAFGTAATQRLGFAAAFSIVIFALLFVFAVTWLRVSGGLKEIYES